MATIIIALLIVFAVFMGHEQLQSPQEPLPLMKLRKPIKTANTISNAIIIVAINIILQLFLDYLM